MSTDEDREWDAHWDRIAEDQEAHEHDEDGDDMAAEQAVRY